jgi:Flp pilus assembly protein TadD
VNYGLMLARQNRIGEATIQLQSVLTPAEVHYNLGSVYEWQGKKDRARVEFRKAIDLDPAFTEAETRLSAIH